MKGRKKAQLPKRVARRITKNKPRRTARIARQGSALDESMELPLRLRRSNLEHRLSAYWGTSSQRIQRAKFLFTMDVSIMLHTFISLQRAVPGWGGAFTTCIFTQVHCRRNCRRKIAPLPPLSLSCCGAKRYQNMQREKTNLFTSSTPG